MITKHQQVPRNHYSKSQKSIAWACLFLQFLPVITSVSAAIPAVALASEQHMLPRPKATQTESGVDPFEQQVARGAVAIGTTLSDEDRTSSEALSDYARAQATNAVNSTAEEWLSQFGTASVQLSLEKHGKLGDSSLDWLLPLYDSPKNMLFTQLGMRHKDDRNTVNIGVGSRFFLQDNWMLGLNTFVDSDITGHNYRLGLGMEAWSDYLKLSANGYRRLSNWHQSRDFEDYDERPANGFDLRVNGFLPSYPQLGGTLVYEQYFGDEVALFGKDNRQKNPYAVTVGANYTPVPMLTFSAEQRMGKGDQSELNLALNMTWQLDKSLQENLSPNAVDGMRRLSRSRYDLVERNNDIVLEYRKQQVIRLTLSPERITGPAGSLQRVTSAVKAKHGLKNVQWQGASFTAAGGLIVPLKPNLYQLTLPAWQTVPGVSQTVQGVKKQSDASRLLNTYVLTATAEDNNGNFSRPDQLTVEVLPPVAHFMGDATVQGDYAPPDGATAVNIQYLIVNGDNQPLSGENVDFDITYANGKHAAERTSSDDKGRAVLPLTSTLAGEANVSAHLSNGETSDVTVHYADANPDTSQSSFNATPATVSANGNDISTLTLVLQDSLSRPVTGLTNINFVAAGVTGTTLSKVSETSAGNYTATLSGTVAGEVTVTPQLDGKALTDMNARITLTGDSQSAHIAQGDMTVTTNNALADGSSQNQITVKVTDNQGNLVADQAVAFRADNGATIRQTGTTDSNGLLSIPVVSMTAGTSTVTATVNGQSQSVTVSFTADNSSAQIAAGDLVVLADGAKANTTASNQIQVKVTDSLGNVLPDMTVTFTASNGAAIAASGMTGAEGTVQLPVTSTKAGISTITATINNSTQSVTTTFVADSDTAAIAAGDLTVITNNALANGVQANKVQVKITDANGNPVAGQDVSFSATNGATVAAKATSDVQGFIQLPVTSKTAGSSTITATLNGASQNVELSFGADGSTAEIASGALTVITDNAAADGSAANQIQVVVTDANGNRLAGQTVSFSATNGATIAATGVTDASGAIEEAITSTTAGESVIEATVNGKAQQVTVTFLADGDSAHFAAGSVIILKDNARADGTDINQIQATVVDKYDNPLPGTKVTFRASNGASVNAQGTTDADGKIVATVSNTTAGITTVGATVNGSEHGVEVTFVADSSTATVTAGNVKVLNDNAVANGLASNQVQVKVTDASGNAVGGESVSLSASNGATVTATGTTDSDGMLTVPITSLTAGSSTVNVTVNGTSQSVSMTFVADASTAQIATGDMKVTSNNAVADGTATNSVQVKVTDANGNPVNGMSVDFTADNGAVIAASAQSDVNGQITLPISSVMAGSSTVTATVNGSSKSLAITFVADSSTAAIASADIVLLNDGAKASGSDPDTVQVTVKDANGNVVPDQTVSFSADNSATVTASGTTDASGITTVAVTSTLAGSSTVTASTNGSSQTVVATFVADSTTAQIQANDIVVTENGALSNGVAQNKVMVKVTDANNNVVGGVDVAFSATNGATVPATATTDASGVVTIPVTTMQSGDSQITATINGSSQSAVVNFIAATIPVITDVVDDTGTVTGSILSGQATNDTLPVLSGTADPNATVRLFDGSTQIGNSTADAEGLWSITPDSAISGEGDHTLTLTGALTPLSDQSPKSEAFILNLDTIAQVPTIDSVTDSSGPVAQGGTTNGDSVTLTGTTEPGATVTVLVTRMFDRVRGSMGSTEADDTGHWKYTLTDPRVFQGSGEYQLTAKTTDIAGNSSKTSGMDPWSIYYESWPAPLGTPEYTLTASGESVDQTQVSALLSSTGSALFISQISTGYSGSIDMPAASAANSGNRVYVSIEGSQQVALRQNGALLKTLSQGSETTWYSTGSTWKQIY
ncbi:Ig-like domain-containing protein [Enterobacter sp. P82]|uniref:Ig-like domain-containing protein n=1 Tax=Enterobacter sp. P82 TaxID=3123033 RepID=UPI00300CABC6